MDTVLMSVTLISLAIAGVLAVFLARLVREERRRSEARITALTAMAGEPEPVHAAAAARPALPQPARSVSADTLRITPEPVRIPQAEPVRITPAARPRRTSLADLEIRPAGEPARADVTGVAELFAPTERESPWGRRLGVIGAIVFVAGTALFFAMQHRGARGGASLAAQPQPIAQSAPAPLELVSLRYTQQGDTLTIAGLVQNPKTGTPMTRLTATAVVFGPDGVFLAGGKAPLDYTTLGAGDESPFVITVPVNGQVARYRVGFRAEDGSVVAHVDRRPGDAVARREP
jgi:hypothetical protein